MHRTTLGSLSRTYGSVQVCQGDPARPDIQEETPVREDPREYVAVPQPPLQGQEVQEQEDVITVPAEVEPPTAEERDTDDPMLQPTSGTKRSAEETPGDEPEGETTKRIKAGDVSLIGGSAKLSR